ncbi:MAG: hypothetical protein Q9207_004866 [Kuettlingeria erythrocarpa]
MVLDVWVVCLPLPIVWQLQMPRKKKIGISGTFALGLLNAAINLGRLVQTILCDEADVTYCLEASAMLIVGELSSGILVACVPTLGPVCFPNRFGPKNPARFQYKMSRRPLQRASSDGIPLHQPDASSVDPSLYEDGSKLQPAEAVVKAVDGHSGKNTEHGVLGAHQPAATC